MTRAKKVSIVLHITEILYSFLLLAWYFLPYFVEMEGLLSPTSIPDQLFGGSEEKLPFLISASLVVYLIPFLAIFKIVGVFLQRRIPHATEPMRALPSLLNILNSGLVIAALGLHIVTFARNDSYFLASSPFMYAVFLVSLGYNAFFVFLFISNLSERNTAYQEYGEFKRSAQDRPRGVFRAIIKQGIQKRLILSFVPMILVIIVVLSFVLMRDFSTTILASVIQNGKNLADRTASTLKANPGDMIAADDYLSIEASKNASSAIPFRDISFFRKDPKEAGVFTIEASTERKLVGERLTAGMEPFMETLWRFNSSENVFEFLAPLTLSGKFLGYVMVDYARDVIYEPYFRTQVKVFAIAAIFIYASIFLIYVSGRAIVIPILFLRMSVNAISNVLGNMVKGKLNFSSDLLQYKDRVPTKDEIKSLSTEIGNMTTVIRGIIPYISTSTLKHSERETPTTERKELTFLFTDIRGFTTLCEGMKADKVVEILNRYLDLQSSIIQANGGDVDKFVGDEVMAMFDGPRKEMNACKSSLEIRTAMEDEKKRASGDKKNLITIGIGINTGPVVFGSVGAKNRMDFTSIGDPVNLAARLEGANKTYGTKTLITEAVHDKVKTAFLCREIDLLTVKGKSEPARIYEVLGFLKDATDKSVQIRKIFEQGLAAYRAQKWQTAEKAFAFLKEKFRDEPSSVFLRRITVFKRDPPERDWDGVFNLTVK
jgi:adenylate cyclase